MEFTGLTYNQMAEIQILVKNFNYKRQHNRSNASDVLNRNDLCGVNFTKQEDSGSYGVSISVDFESEFSGKGNLQKGRYRMLGRMVRRGSEEVDGQRLMNINMAGGRLPKKNGKHLFDVPDTEAFTFNSNDEQVLREMAQDANFRKCDCCNRGLFRDQLYVVENVDNPGQYAALGTTCINEVCVDKDLKDLMSNIDAIVNGEIVDKSRNAKGNAEKWFLEPRKFMACAYVAGKLDLPSLVKPKTFESYDVDAVEKAVNDISGYHTYKKNVVTQESDSVIVSDSPLCAWAKLLYKSMYVYSDKVSPAVKKLLDMKDIKSMCESPRTLAVVDTALDFSELNECVSDEDKIAVQGGDDLWTLSAGEAMISLLDKSFVSKKGVSLYSDTIKYRQFTREESRCFESAGNRVYVSDLTRHNIPVNRSVLSSILKNNEWTVPARAIDKDIPVPSYKIKFYNCEGDKVSDRVGCTYEFADKKTSGYYRTSDGMYSFYSQGKPMWAMSANRIREIFCNQHTVENLMGPCTVMNDNIPFDKAGSEIMKDLQYHHKRHSGSSLLPICNKSYFCSDGSTFMFHECSNSHCLVSCKHGDKLDYVKVLPLSSVGEYVSRSEEYIKDTIEQVRQVYREREAACEKRVKSMERSIDYCRKNLDRYNGSRMMDRDIDDLQGRKTDLRCVQDEYSAFARRYNNMPSGDSKEVIKVMLPIQKAKNGSSYATGHFSSDLVPGGRGTIFGIEKHLSAGSQAGRTAVLVYRPEEKICIHYENGKDKNGKKHYDSVTLTAEQVWGGDSGREDKSLQYDGLGF